MDVSFPFFHLLASLVFENKEDCRRWEGMQRNTSLQRKHKSNVTKQLHYCTSGVFTYATLLFCRTLNKCIMQADVLQQAVCLISGQIGENIFRGQTDYCSMFYESMCKMCMDIVFKVRWTIFMKYKWETLSHLWIKSSRSNGTAIKQTSWKYGNILHCPHWIHEKRKQFKRYV